jgi:hypothetical protein
MKVSSKPLPSKAAHIINKAVDVGPNSNRDNQNSKLFSNLPFLFWIKYLQILAINIGIRNVCI